MCVCTHAHLMHAGSTMRPLSPKVDKPNSCDRESMYTWHTDKQVGAKQQAGTPHTSQHQQHITHNIELYTSV